MMRMIQGYLVQQHTADSEVLPYGPEDGEIEVQRIRVFTDLSPEEKEALWSGDDTTVLRSLVENTGTLRSVMIP